MLCSTLTIGDDVMSELDNFKAMLDRAEVDYVELISPAEWEDDASLAAWLDDLEPETATIIIVMPGYRCHYEANFNANGNLISTGQFGDL